MYDKIYCISGKDTVWENTEVLSRNGIDEILCLRPVGGIYYCPDLHVAFERQENSLGEVHYNWDKAIFPAYDERMKEIRQNPFWRTHICRIDLPKQKLTEEEVLAAL